MKLHDIATETLSALVVNRVRSGLTMLGIVIGIASVISMIAIGQGAQSAVQANIESIGSNLLTVTPGSQQTPGSYVSSGAGSAQSLTVDDADAIAQITSVKAVAPEVSGRYQIVAKSTNTNASTVGTNASYVEVKNVTMEQGAFITDQHVSKMSKVVVLGSSVRDDLFGEGSSPVGQKVRINAISFTIVGVTESKGGTGFGSIDENVFIPLSTAQQFLTGGTSVNTINVQAVDADSTTVLQEEITALLLDRHDIANPTLADFRIRNMADVAATASSITQTFTLLLGAVAGISLVVGGIGIMNMMLTTVTERTREIGLRKAIGAKTRDIRIQFLVEAMLLTFIGGVVGIVLGFGIAFFVSTFVGITAEVTLAPVALAFGVSVTIGIVFGYYPAFKASKLRPIEALRYE